ncbi:hypothetical protein SLS54_003970 [Diplodia seriata]
MASIKRLFACLDDADDAAAPHPQGSSRSADSSAKKPRVSALRRLSHKLRRNPVAPTRSFKGPTDHTPHVRDHASPDADPTCADRRWGPVLSIPDDALVSLVQLFTFSTLSKSATAITVLARTNGRDNAVYTLQYNCPHPIKVCVRIPACGWGDRWLPSDQDALRNAALTMRYLRNRSRLPVPDVLQYDTTFNNALQAPYILMSYVDGRPLSDVWYDTSTPTALTLEEKRQNSLHSLAFAVASLRSLTFPQMGPLLFHATNGDHPDQHPYVDAAVMAPFGRDPVVGPAPSKEGGEEKDPQHDDQHFSTPEHDSRAFFFSCLDAARTYAIARERTAEVRGVFKMWRLLMEEMPWPGYYNSPSSSSNNSKNNNNSRTNTKTSRTTTITSSTATTVGEIGEYEHSSGNRDETENGTGETFALAPPADFDASNILVDPRTGAVVGVVDWDGLETQPLMLGWAACPDLLAVDWMRGLSWPRRPPYSPSMTMTTNAMTMMMEDGRGWDAYRADYAAYLREAVRRDGGGEMDGGALCELYARKGHLYQAVLRSLDDLDRMREVLDRVLEVTLPRVRRAELVTLVGEAGLSGEQERFIRGRFRELLT